MKLSRFAHAYVADKKLRMNWFETKLNLGLKEQMSVRHYALFKNIYDTTVNVERAMKERTEFYNRQWGIKGSGD